jgi:hypothetical protein
MGEGQGVFDATLADFFPPRLVGDQRPAAPGVRAVHHRQVRFVAPGEQAPVGAAGGGFPFQRGGQALALETGERVRAPPVDRNRRMVAVGRVVVVAGDAQALVPRLVTESVGHVGVVPLG